MFSVIFDMDGTLTDSMTMWRTLRQRYVRYKGCEPEENLDKKLAEMGWEESYDYLRKTYGIAIESDSEMYEDMKGYVAYYYKNEVALKKNVKELKIIEKNGGKLLEVIFSKKDSKILLM